MRERNVTRRQTGETRSNAYRTGDGLAGLLMTNAALPPSHPVAGSFALAALSGAGALTHLTGWPSAKWWTSSWHFPNRTPGVAVASAEGEEEALIGNYYCTRFADAWRAAEYAARNLTALKKRTRLFLSAMRESTLPAAVKEGAMANLSTLVTQTCFRTADGEFHGFEGSSDQQGCCFGNCTHVWNYETATQHLFPSLARSLRKSAFGFSEDFQGAMRHRQLLPDGKERYGYAAADGQMGQIMKAYMDWKLSGERGLLDEYWPKVKRAVEFCWVRGGWDADRDGVMEGVQHNTYDVEFYGPNPMCGIYYLGGLRAAEEMARAVGDGESARQYRELFLRGGKAIDEQLFNGKYYIQKVRSIPKESIAPATISDMGSDRQGTPDFQLGEGCLVDQLVGQYLAEVARLGDLVSRQNVRTKLQSIYRYNYKRKLRGHESVQRIFALNDEAALVICDYGTGRRPDTPFPYFAEVMTGFEYQAIAHMMYAGMVREGIECFENIRRRYDGERRNPWDEAECGHHYARAMASWSAVLALSGFEYHGGERRVTAAPRISAAKFQSFWSTGTGWGSFSTVRAGGAFELSLAVSEGRLPVRSLRLAPAPGTRTFATLNGGALKHKMERREAESSITFDQDLDLKPGDTLRVRL